MISSPTAVSPASPASTKRASASSWSCVFHLLFLCQFHQGERTHIVRSLRSILSSEDTSMSSIEMQGSHLSDGLLEAPTMSSKQIKHAREQALKILKTKSPQEALKIFTEGSEVKADHQLSLREKKVETATMPPTPNTAEAKPNGSVQHSPKN